MINLVIRTGMREESRSEDYFLVLTVRPKQMASNLSAGRNPLTVTGIGLAVASFLFLPCDFESSE